jgi:hypothetical protein
MLSSLPASGQVADASQAVEKQETTVEISNIFISNCKLMNFYVFMLQNACLMVSAVGYCNNPDRRAMILRSNLLFKNI